MSHASKDKKYVKQLVRKLTSAGVKVWYDEDSISWGESLRPTINRGLLNSRHAIVVLSKAFLEVRKWTEQELNGLFAREKNGQLLILPIWHGISHADILDYDPALADRLAKVSETDSHKEIVASILKILGRPQNRPASQRSGKNASALISAANRANPEEISKGHIESLREKNLFTVSGSRFELTDAQLRFAISSEEYVLPLDDVLRDRIVEAAPSFEIHAPVITRHIDKMLEDAERLVPDVRDRLARSAEKTAENLTRKAEIGDAVFNAQLFNVLRMPTGADKEENSTVVVELYRTDYFTLQTLLRTFHEVISTASPELDFNLSEVRHALRIFRTGFGLNCTVCVVPRSENESRPAERMLIFGRRSARAGQTSSTGTWHVTANEALTLKDVVDQQISLRSFVERALDEEVGIHAGQIGRTYVFNVYVYLADMQPGMNALVFCEVDNLNEIFVRIGGSMDGTVEYDSHIAIPFRDDSINEALHKRGWPDSRTGEVIPFSATADSLLRSLAKRGVHSFPQGF